MALIQITVFDRIDPPAGEFKICQVREKVILADEKTGEEVEFITYHRKTVKPNDNISDEYDEVKEFAKEHWTEEIKTAYINHMQALENPDIYK